VVAGHPRQRPVQNERAKALPSTLGVDEIKGAPLVALAATAAGAVAAAA